ncbi:shikimate 5-dehydrogenase [Celerinatantimonas yamalensis]|uniref:Shikimate 5-dehydrogenase n=1 Tax=Celerinatantimonas yamalensis TaxID=559956 RepID=A0ABW9G5Q0_9GAMM
MTRQITKDTILCMSLASRPGNFGTRFHNFLYEALDLDYLYKAFTTDNLAAAIAGVRALRVRGCAISMPFKEDVIALVDEMMPSAAQIQSVNTIVNDNGYLKAYNTDYLAIETLLKDYQVSNQLTFALQGSGGMAKAVAGALHHLGFRQGVIVARNEQAGRKLAQLYDYQWAASADDCAADLLVNATPLGMTGADAQVLAFSEARVDSAQVIFDVVASPSKTPLIELAKQRNKTIITGSEVFALQAVEQFALYTGVRPELNLFEQAARYARAAQ